MTENNSLEKPMLPEIKKVKPLPYFTPTKWQTVILRNYGIVDIRRIAAVLETTLEEVERQASLLGIDKIKFNPNWKRLGYITVIRNNWHLLPYDQLLTLLDMDEKTLDYNLREDDFLNVKLGLFKPACQRVVYSPLTKEQLDKTKQIAGLISQNFIPTYHEPFDFYSDKPQKRAADSKNADGFDRIVYSYSMLYGDTFMDEGEIVPDSLLESMQAMGVNGLWVQGVLAKLSPYPFVSGMDEGYKTRRKNLIRLIERCKRYGIGVFLYLNEPRGIPDNLLSEQTQKIKGRFYEERWSLCTTTQPVKQYLYDAVKGLVGEVRELAGIITITMSENMTNCHSRPDNDCPFCKHLRHQDVVPEVNNIMQRAVDDAGVKTRIIANLWCWTSSYGWSQQDTLEGIEKMNPKIDVLSVSELGTIINNGKAKEVTEYSLSNVGPCEQTKTNLTYAKRLGHKILAKVQVNNSWEMAIVPFVPVFDLIIQHMSNLKGLGVDGLMMSWTLGGYPTVSLDLARAAMEDNFDYDEWLSLHFEDNMQLVKSAVALFSQAFTHYPFDIRTLYCGNQQCGPANLLYPESTGLKATMVGFSYDDVSSWFGGFTKDEYLSRLNRLLDLWEQGLELIKNAQGTQALRQLKRYAEVVYLNLKSTAVQIEFNLIRRSGDRSALLNLLSKERELTLRLYKLCSQDCKIGYEASNHYYFTQNAFLEKLVNIEHLKNLYQ